MPASVVLDIVVIVLLIAAAVSGWRSGFLRSVFTAIGLVVGGIAAYLLLPVFATWTTSPGWRIAIVLGGGILLLVVGEAIGSMIGRLLSRGVRVIKLGPIDRAAGLVTSTVVVALVLTTVAGGISGFGIPPVTQAIAGSATLSSIDRLTPAPAKSFLAGVRASTVNDALPWVIDTIAPPTSVPPIADLDTASPALTTAGASVVRVSGNAYQCGQSLTGSGFVVSDDRVVTNAHVVAGVDEPVVEAPGEQPRAASVVYFDDATDLAVLEVDGLDASPLPLGDVPTVGSAAAVQGFPFGGPFVSLPATIAELSTIPKADASGQRDVYALSADINQGNSGGPLLSPDGAVIGVVFAKSAAIDDVGYALAISELQPVVAAAAGLSDTVSSGACAA
ncbi:MAG: MarP family serine protease [Leifsonia flava]